jgi:hypothetical protein
MGIHPIFERSFRKLYGKPCWNVKQGYGSFLTLEFGAPHLIIREPRKPSRGMSKRVRENLARRLVYVRGDWHLWLYCCDWTIYDRSKRRADSESSKRTIERAANVLNGQALQQASFHYRGCRSVFEFDLGGRLVVKSWPPAYEAWLLYEPTAKVLTLKADKTFSHHPGDTLTEPEVWRPAWSSG